MNIRILQLCLLLPMFFSCQGNDTLDSEEHDAKSVEVSLNEIKIESPNNALTFDEKINLIRKNTANDLVLSFDKEFINNQILKNKYEVKLSKYLKKECYPIQYNKLECAKNHEGFQNIGDIDNDKKDDFVFVLNPLSYCEEGQSYYFSNPKINRIYTESNCCHPKSIYKIGDIDEDGSNEIAQYYSSCSSRYKSIIIWTLKENEWLKLGQFIFTLNDEYEIFKDFHKLFKKQSKGVFQFLEISDVNAEGKIISAWRTVKML